jgi:hypothetical protein
VTRDAIPPLQLTFGEFKAMAALLSIADDAEIWVEQRPRSDGASGLLHAIPSIGVKSEPAPAGYARLIVTVSAAD